MTSGNVRQAGGPNPNDPIRDIKTPPQQNQGAKPTPLPPQEEDAFVRSEGPVSEAVQEVATTVSNTVPSLSNLIRKIFNGPKGLSDRGVDLVARDTFERYKDVT